MKRTPLRRRNPLRRVPRATVEAFDRLLANIVWDRKPRKRLRKVGARSKREAPALAAGRKAALERAGHRCERCGKTRGLHCHHKVRRSRAPGWAGLHKAGNLEVLCAACHRKEHDG